ncbi:MAG: gamma-glutamyltransferase, partial [Rhodospirillales bacterium]|nr:gamma-glutamyltransferase [Rhodospirillales bacterium]
MNRNVEQWQVRKLAVSSERGVVAAQNWMSAAAGADALSRGGNAVDAAIACAFALNAVEPWMCGMGGSGYIVIWLADERRAVAIDFQGTLPNAIDTADYPLDPGVPNAIMGFPGVAGNANVVGYKSITVPGAVAGLSAAAQAHGRLGFDSLLSPAIQLAERGLPVDWFATLQIGLEAGELARFPASAAVYLPGGAPAQPEQFLNLGNLGATLRMLADEGPDAFYKGAIATAMAEDLQEGGSRITVDDLAAYRPQVLTPLAHDHRGAILYTPSENSGGQRLSEAFDFVTEHLDPSRPFGAHAYEIYAKALNQAFDNHERRLGRLPETGSTSHMSAVDADGNMVALTYTLLNRFGSKVVLPSSGVLMNNA